LRPEGTLHPFVDGEALILRVEKAPRLVVKSLKPAAEWSSDPPWIVSRDSGREGGCGPVTRLPLKGLLPAAGKMMGASGGKERREFSALLAAGERAAGRRGTVLGVLPFSVRLAAGRWRGNPMHDMTIGEPEPNPSTRALEHGGVRFARGWVGGMEHGKPFIRIPREKILNITLRWGHLAARPLTQALLGMIVLMLGCWPLVTFVENVFRGGLVAPKIQALLGTLTVLGAWLIVGAFRRGFYLEVEASGRREKVPFERDVDKRQIDDFLSYVRREAGYVVEDGVVTSPPSAGER
jgi:hypothetical protein